MEYPDSSYHGQHGQDSSSLASQHQAGGLAGSPMDGLPLMSPSHPSLPFSLLNSGNAVAKSLSASLDSVPMGLGPSGMMSHPNYGSVASYMSAPPTPMGNKGGAINTAVVPGTVARPAPPPGPQRSQSTHTTATGGQSKPLKKRRTRTSSMTSSSSIASSGIMSSITSTLGSTNISFTEPPPPPGMHQHHQHQQHHHHTNHNNHNHHYSSSLPNLSMPSVLSGAEFSDESSHNNSGGGGFHGLAIATGSNPTAGGGSSSTSSSPTSGKPRPGGHPRSAVAARVFECSFPGCNKAYTQLHNLKSHERTGHTPVQKPRPFLCIIPGCTKAFSQRKSLALHIRASHKEYKFKPFKCSQQGCDKSYTQLHNLRTHEKTVHMLDLSRKRIRNPVPYSEDGGSSSGGMKMEGNGGGASSMMMAGLSGSSSSLDRGGHFSGDVGLSYESIDDLNDFSAAGRMPVDGEEYDRRRGPMGVGGSIGEDDEEDEEGLADLKEEGDDEEDGDYVDE